MSSDSADVAKKHCINCGELIEDAAGLCPDCGVRQSVSAISESATEKHCTNCGEQIAIEAEICPDCGVSQDYNSTSSSDISDEATNAGDALAMMISYYRENPLRGIIHVIIGVFTGGVWFGWFFWFWLGTYMEWKNMEKLKEIHNSS